MKPNQDSDFLWIVGLIVGILLFTTLMGGGEPQMMDFDADEKEAYSEEWAKVQSYDNDGLPREALTLVEQIGRLAERDKNDVQLLKSTIQAIYFESKFSDGWQVPAEKRLKAAIALAKFPLKPILHSILGQFYWDYESSISGYYRNQTALDSLPDEDFRTWDGTRLAQEADAQYQLSLADAKTLRRIPFDYWEPVCSNYGYGNDARYRPSLLDLLAWRAIDYYAGSASRGTLPVAEYVMDDPQLLADDKTFLEATIATPDTNSPSYKSLLIFQVLTAAHAHDRAPEARVMLQIERLKYVSTEDQVPQGDSLYLASLQQLHGEYAQDPIGALVAAEIAQYYLQRADAPNAKNYRAKALAVVEAALQGDSDTDGAAFCRGLRSQILSKHFQTRMDKHLPVGKPSLAQLSYTNVDRLWFRIVQVPHRLPHFTTPYDSDLLPVEEYLRLSIEHDWELTLPRDDDHAGHELDMMLPALPPGNYMLLAGTSASFSLEQNAVEMTAFTVTDLCDIHRPLPDGRQEHLVMDRGTGQPLAGVDVRIFEFVDDGSSGYTRQQLRNVLKTNAEGIVSIPRELGDAKYTIALAHGPDTLTGESYYQTLDPATPPQSVRRTQFFTDRAIYRPGQTIYFKGIVMDLAGNQSKVVAQHDEVVALHDANDQVVAKLSLRTNAFGSFAGTFIAPKGGMNGQMSLQTKDGSIQFAVEDYKRPQFEVEFEPVKGSFKLGQMVTAKGKATAYAGSKIAQAKVQYRVVRNASFPWCGFWGWHWGLPSAPAKEIAHGSVITDAEGAFEIAFEAVADGKLKPESRPKYSYTVSVDVVDLTGETQSAATNVSVGYQAIDLNVELPEQVESSAFTRLKIKALNLNGEAEPTRGEISIHSLQSPEHVVEERNEHHPDRFLQTRADFKRQFPEHPYADEAMEEKWPIKEQVYKGKFDTQASDSIVLGDIHTWPQGRYVLEATCKDKFGTLVKYKQYFTVYDRKAAAIPYAQAFWMAELKPQYAPGDTVHLDFATGYEDVWMRLEIGLKGQIQESRWVCLSPQRTRIDIPVTEAHRGNLSVSCMFVKNGLLAHHSSTVNVPWSNKELDITFGTFRDKLLPGSPEEWTVKIKGHQGERVAAELLATMYDASLDAFASNQWAIDAFSDNYGQTDWAGSHAFARTQGDLIDHDWRGYGGTAPLSFGGLDLPNFYYGMGMHTRYDIGTREEPTFGSRQVIRGGNYGALYNRYATYNWVSNISYAANLGTAYTYATTAVGNAAVNGFYTDDTEDSYDRDFSIVASAANNRLDVGPIENKSPSDQSRLSGVKVRTILGETAFFFPQLRTDAEGNVVLRFTAPEALTRWKFMTLAHTQDLGSAYKAAEVVTQKQLMVQPNAPRFLREGDVIDFVAKASNLSTQALSGKVQLELLDALTGQPIDQQLGNAQPILNLQLAAGENKAMHWRLKIPAGIQAVTYRVKAFAGEYSDGEESSLPVLTNSMLVTEAMPMPLRPLESKTFEFTKLRNNKSSTLRHHRLTFEFTSNPAWYAIQALPYMMEFPYECTEQTFSRYYANSIASHIANSQPRIKAVFKQWQAADVSTDSSAFLSKLAQNEELKYVLLEETPWVLDAQNEGERKRRLGLLFDLAHMTAELHRTRKQLMDAQLPNGGFAWFPGMGASRYITQHVVCGFGHLDHLGVQSMREDRRQWRMLTDAVDYLDAQIKLDYVELTSQHRDLKAQQIGGDQVQYLYARSYFPELAFHSERDKASQYYLGQAKQYWPKFSPYYKGMIALALHRSGDHVTPAAILRSLKEYSTQSEEMGMYWKAEGDGMYWYEAPIETQALLIEAFDEVADDQKSVAEMKLWLLKQKQTQDWKTTKATAEACYALLLRGSDFLAESKLADITIGGKKLDPANDPQLKVEAGTGYFKTSWPGNAVKPAMGTVAVKNNNKVAAWGAVYWQYFEQLDKITFAGNKVNIRKELFLQQNTNAGPVLTPITSGKGLHPGDLVKVRIVIENDRDMEYVHMKDMRASGLEPINVLSQYQYQNGLGYYESTRDAATNFFFDWLPKGKHVFEYPLRATYQGDFSNGITTIQCMYAPEFTSHSEGQRLRIGG